MDQTAGLAEGFALSAYYAAYLELAQDCTGSVHDCHVAEARACLVSRTAGAGRVRRKTVPAPVDEARLNSPPWARTSSRAIARPSPLPPGRAEPKNGRKRISRALGGSPWPSSATSIATVAASRVAAKRSRCAPASTALRARLRNTR